MKLEEWTARTTWIPRDILALGLAISAATQVPTEHTP